MIYSVKYDYRVLYQKILNTIYYIKDMIALPRKTVSVTLPLECVEWINQQVKDRTYHNASHAIECVILKAIKNGKEG